ncbi:MAG: ABC transporter permease [Anaerolineales bacterium]|nr:ABC transporter permease [Anaerolineales bacterium]
MHPRLDRIIDALLPAIATLAALGVGAVMLLLLGANPIEGYIALLDGAFGSLNALADTIVKATPLLLVGLGICIAFRGGMINIGGEGQMILGAIFATAVGLAIPGAPGWILVPVALLVGFLAGAIWGGIAGYLKARFGVSEILSTIMMNAIAIQLMNFLLSPRGPMIDRDQPGAALIPQTARLDVAYDLPRLVPTRLHLGVFLAVVLAFAVYFFLWRTTVGYRIRAVGLSAFASRYAGFKVSRYMVLSMFLSGAFSGLAGAVQIYGVNHRMITDGSAAGFTGLAGFNGIVAALFGQLHPIGTIPASFFFGALRVGANKLQRVAQVPASLIVALNGLVVVFVVSSELLRRRRARRREIAMVQVDEEAPQAEAAVESAGGD